MGKAIVMQCGLLHVRDVNKLDKIRTLERGLTIVQIAWRKKKKKSKRARFELPAFGR